MKRHGPILLVLFWLMLACGCATHAPRVAAVVAGPLMQWHAVTLTFEGPQTNEIADPNPFLDYRLNVTFSRWDRRYVVPGYYAADGDAANTGANSGNRWRVHFVPDEVGLWTYTVSFRTGPAVALMTDPNVGTPAAFDGVTGTFVVNASDKLAPDLRAKGLLRYTGARYLQFAQTGEYFIKAGADSPENFLAYADFDDTYDTEELRREGEATGPEFIHRYEPHVQDWREGDPTWKDGKGKAIIGALNYLASKGMNSVYFLTYNVDGGDGKDVWPWVVPGDKMRFDCSKLDQWDIVFSHMDRLGLMLHVVTQETENDQALDAGELGPQRKLYYRELIARFGHHLALVWNLGEENTNTDAQRKAFCKYIRDIDPYDHPIVCHTYPGKYDEVYTPLLGFPDFEGPSLQTNDTHAQTLKWLDASKEAGRQWFVCLDEIGPAHMGVKPDNDDYAHDEVRKKHLWANLMAGGAGVEWYFGYQFAHNDLNCESWRSREHMWNLTRYAVEFIRDLPFARMVHHDELTSAEDDYCFAEPGTVYAIYLPSGGTTDLDLGTATGAFRIRWFNPREGGPLQVGTLAMTSGPGLVNIGQPALDTDKDWVALIVRSTFDHIGRIRY
ncbi:MAG TPA: DUF5060 domain-containing protein [Sedimentisphaerales bacterium]|nr:DUF5060 domain-containing protein [Sedimentisphaerales bacterium]HRS12537.1 DUF5060 domain-containing protein [Sedimentisphaerales bacterium]HRV49215.1 DUF5060 domain-containing protein [Sedimentisphaerales bacterium]